MCFIPSQPHSHLLVKKVPSKQIIDDIEHNDDIDNNDNKSSVMMLIAIMIR